MEQKKEEEEKEEEREEEEEEKEEYPTTPENLNHMCMTKGSQGTIFENHV